MNELTKMRMETARRSAVGGTLRFSVTACSTLDMGDKSVPTTSGSRGGLICAGLLALLATVLSVPAATLIYRTTFEGHEGYNASFALSGQNNWVQEGSGGNGLVSNFITGQGQQAYIGFTPPTGAGEFLNVWRPINFAPVPTNLSVVTFSVTMMVADSANGRRDDFRWSIYNTNGSRLFTLDFDNSTEGISYVLDDGGGFVATGFQFTRDAVHELAITMSFGRNRWQAALDGFVLTSPLPITTTNAALNLGDVDAVWAIRTPGTAGDNFLVFDNYTISGDAPVSVPSLLSVARPVAGQLRLQVQAEQAMRHAIEVSTNLTNWTAVVTNSAPSGAFEVVDGSPASLPRRFYRVRVVGP
ncbi:MAG: hypothetical protein B9S33_04645 [Pedosphaera sp. Tous-C6FEB]|nr:MAG: hypothetical protein B9S33_04645 [Pedosphaera sp. Tous-C6FEB]